MEITSAKKRYSTGAMIFHWLIAALVIANWYLAERAHDVGGAAAGELFGYHKAIGISILALTLARLALRLTTPLPRLPQNYASWERILARTTHVVFYILLIGLPLGAWIANSLGGKAIDMFGLFTIPALPVGENKQLGGQIFELHATGGSFLMILVILHVLGALKHTFFDRDGGIFRMLPFGRV